MIRGKIAFKVIIFLVLAISFSACSGDNQIDPVGTAVQMDMAISQDNYEEFKSLFFEPRRSLASQELFNQLKEIKAASSGANFNSYTLITFKNGEMVLVNLTPNSKGKTEIQDVIFVPDNVKDFFVEHLNP